MAIVGIPGWIGSSAVAETGQRSMAAAASVLGIGTPFMMSALAGKARSFTITVSTVTWTTPLNGDAVEVGVGVYGYNGQRFGAISPNTVWGGLDKIQATNTRNGITGIISSPSNNTMPRRDLILNIGGTNFTFIYTDIPSLGTYTHNCNNPNAMYQFLAARLNQTLVCTPQN